MSLVSLVSHLYRKQTDPKWFILTFLSNCHLHILVFFSFSHLFPPVTASLHPCHLCSSVALSACLSVKVSTSKQESRDAECWAHKFCLVWNRRWIPRTAGRFFITRAFLVPSTATSTCHQTHAALCVYVYVFGTWRSKCMAELRRQKWPAEEGKCQKEKDGMMSSGVAMFINLSSDWGGGLKRDNHKKNHWAIYWQD